MGVAAITGYTLLELLARDVLDQLREDSAASIHSTIVSNLELVVSVRKLHSGFQIVLAPNGYILLKCRDLRNSRKF